MESPGDPGLVAGEGLGRSPGPTAEASALVSPSLRWPRVWPQVPGVAGSFRMVAMGEGREDTLCSWVPTCLPAAVSGEQPRGAL